MKCNICIFLLFCFSLFFLNCSNPSGGTSSNDGNTNPGGTGSKPNNPEITNFTISIMPNKIRTSFAVHGTIVANINNVKGGTPPFAFHFNNDLSNGNNNDLFFIDGGAVKINENNLLPASYNLNIRVTDKNNMSFSKPITIVIYPNPISGEQDARIINNDSFKMRFMPAGSFTTVPFGNAYYETEVISIIKGFWISETLVTQELFQKIIGYNPSFYPNEKSPVENITIGEAVLFCNRLSQLSGFKPVYVLPGVNDWLAYSVESIKNININSFSVSSTAEGYRLPDEYEWQWAAVGADKGGDSSTGYKKCYSGGLPGDLSRLGNYAWFLDNSNMATHEVGQKLPNEMGLFDMTGNVMEFLSNGRVSGGSAFNSDIQVDNLIYQFTIGGGPQTKHNPIGIRLVSYR